MKEVVISICSDLVEKKEDRENVENKQTIPQMDGVGSDLYLHVQHDGRTRVRAGG